MGCSPTVYGGAQNVQLLKPELYAVICKSQNMRGSTRSTWFRRFDGFWVRWSCTVTFLSDGSIRTHMA